MKRVLLQGDADMATRSSIDPETLEVVCPHDGCDVASGLIQRDKRPAKFTGTDWPILYRPIHHYNCGCCHKDFTIRARYFMGGYDYLLNGYLPAWILVPLVAIGVFGAAYLFIGMFALAISLIAIFVLFIVLPELFSNEERGIVSSPKSSQRQSKIPGLIPAGFKVIMFTGMVVIFGIFGLGAFGMFLQGEIMGGVVCMAIAIIALAIGSNFEDS